jgi:queuine tRNA-ribosyltransferase subunit QTRTD1
VTPQEYMSKINALKPDFITSLGDIEHPMDGNIQKRLLKSVKRSLSFLDFILQNTTVPVFGLLVGGLDLKAREYSSLETSSRAVDGYCIALNSKLTASSNALGVSEWVQASLKHTQPEKPRMVTGASNFMDILECIRLGIDLFDASFVQQYTSNGKALLLYFGESLVHVEPQPITIDLSLPEFKNDYSNVDVNCSCLACKNHSRAYIHHLIITKEMLSMVLLQIHNLTVLQEFMKQVQNSLQKGAFESHLQRFKEKMLEYPLNPIEE